MEANNFYSKSLSAAGNLANSQDNAGLQVFNSGGPGSTKVLNTNQAPGFRSAIGSTGLASKFYGADGDTSVPPTSSTATPAVTSTNTSIFTMPQASLGFNFPTLLILTAGAVIGFYISKKNIL